MNTAIFRIWLHHKSLTPVAHATSFHQAVTDMYNFYYPDRAAWHPDNRADVTIAHLVRQASVAVQWGFAFEIPADTPTTRTAAEGLVDSMIAQIPSDADYGPRLRGIIERELTEFWIGPHVTEFDWVEWDNPTSFCFSKRFNSAAL